MASGKTFRSAVSANKSQAYGGGERFSIPIPIFTTQGYAVLVVDCPLGPEGVGGNPIQEMTDTILRQVYHAIELGYTDLNHIAIAGHSYGGYGTVGIVTQTKLFRAAIALDGVYDLAGNYAHMASDGTTSRFRWSETGQGRMGTYPWADLNRYIANSPCYLADKMSTPLLLIHGESDTASPVEESRKIKNTHWARIWKHCPRREAYHLLAVMERAGIKILIALARMPIIAILRFVSS
jgi:dipeptidyl aminopeptidase/acylaminoacyl peptidase